MVNIKFEFEDSNAWLSKICIIRLWQLLKSSDALHPKPKPKLPSTTHSSSITTHKDMELKRFATWICKNTQCRWNPGRVEEYPSVVWSVFKNVNIKVLENFLIAKEISFQTQVNELHFLVICVCFIALLASFCDYYC